LRHPALKAIATVAAAGALAAATIVVWQSTREPAARPFSTNTFQTVRDTLRPGQTLTTLLQRRGIDPTSISAALARLDLDPRTLPAGLEVSFKVTVEDSTVTEIGFRRNRSEEVLLTRSGVLWSGESIPIGWHEERSVLGGYFDQELRLTVDSLVSGPGLTTANQAELVARLAEVFGWQVDFAREVGTGDRFRVIVDIDVSNEGQQELRALPAVELTLGGESLEAFWFQPLRGPAGYYDGEGRSLRRPFLRAPLEFRRISSTFATLRLHPVLARIRAHQGVDYAAAEGTPVLAAGAGLVAIAGPAGDFGNLVEIDHGNGVKTRYGHLKRVGPGIRVGQSVVQGTVVGFVGQTGLATAPHLHYEFLVHGVPRDLRWLDVDPGDPISPAMANAFEGVRDQLRNTLRPLGFGPS
jgi:murein DD-endopeptidase MepM/ murein hydrolase activator NlpD